MKHLILIGLLCLFAVSCATEASSEQPQVLEAPQETIETSEAKEPRISLIEVYEACEIEDDDYNSYVTLEGTTLTLENLSESGAISLDTKERSEQLLRAEERQTNLFAIRDCLLNEIGASPSLVFAIANADKGHTDSEQLHNLNVSWLGGGYTETKLLIEDKD